MIRARLAAWPLVLLILVGGLACRRQSAGHGVQPKVYEVTKAGRLVLTVKDAPGSLLSTASPDVEKPIPRHPFLSARAYSARDEEQIGRLLRQARDTQGFLALLRANGYQVRQRLPR